MLSFWLVTKLLQLCMSCDPAVTNQNGVKGVSACHVIQPASMK